MAMFAIGRFVLLFTAVMLWPTAPFAQVNVIISGGFLAVYSEVLPEFERTTGIKVSTTRGSSQGSGPNTVGGQLRRNVPADVVILNREGLAELMVEARILAGTDVSLAQSELGVGVRAGTSKPDISTVETFRDAMLRAKSVVTDSGTSGIYLANIAFPRLGIADAMRKKTSPGGADAVARGDAEIVIRLVSEMIQVSGVDVVGKVPADLRFVARFAAAIVAGSGQVGESRRLIELLASDRTRAAMARNGMESLSSEAGSGHR